MKFRHLKKMSTLHCLELVYNKNDVNLSRYLFGAFRNGENKGLSSNFGEWQVQSIWSLQKYDVLEESQNSV